MNDSAKKIEKPTNMASTLAICWLRNVTRGTAVSYVIHISGHSFTAASACISATTIPHSAAWRHSTHRARSM